MANSAYPNGGIAQIGWAKEYSWGTSDPYYFYEWGNTTSMNPPVQIQLDDGSDNNDEFTVYQNGNNDTLFIWDGVGVANIPDSDLGWTPEEEEYFGELWNASGDQMPGSNANHVYFKNPQYLAAGTWYNQNVNGGSGGEESNDSTYGKYQVVSGTEFEIWDSRY